MKKDCQEGAVGSAADGVGDAGDLEIYPEFSVEGCAGYAQINDGPCWTCGKMVDKSCIRSVALITDVRHGIFCSV